MENPIEAKSLTSLNELADNPPTKLTEPLRRSVRGSLVLYIARVPGSRDVFLTTMKPRQKVVTAQDVESSLYYCHLETTEDEAARASMQYSGHNEDSDSEDPTYSDDIQSSSTQPQGAEPLTRQSLIPPHQNAIELSNHEVAVYPQHEENNQHRSPLSEADTQRIPRKPVSPSRPTIGAEQTLPRRPLGPRPLDPRSINHHNIPHNSLFLSQKENAIPQRQPTEQVGVPARKPVEGLEQLREAPRALNNGLPRQSNIEEWSTPGIVRDGAPPPLRLRQGTDMSEISPNIDMTPRGRRENSPTSSEGSFITSKGFTVTIIRRDPVTGGQWNIGKVTKNAAASGSKVRKVALEISSGSYDKFADESDNEADDDEVPSFAYTPFRRNLNLGRQKPERRNSKQQSYLRGPNELKYDGTYSPQPPTNDAENPSMFSFTSPWKGSCNFSTGIAGRTLKCRHTYPPMGPESASFEPKLQLLNSNAVSDLRLNLPVLKSKRRHGHRPTLSANPSRTSWFGPTSPALKAKAIGHRLTRSIDAKGDDAINDVDEWDDTTARLDLTLGQERAGGGFHGNKAKLGKLIVEGDGMLMLDLVVLANMGFWWSVTSND